MQKTSEKQVFLLSRKMTIFQSKMNISQNSKDIKKTKTWFSNKGMSKDKSKKFGDFFHEGKQKGNRNEDRSEAQSGQKHKGADDRLNGKRSSLRGARKRKEGRAEERHQMVADSLEKCENKGFANFTEIFFEKLSKRKVAQSKKRCRKQKHGLWVLNDAGKVEKKIFAETGLH